jgi:hypothetical protein
MPDKETGTERVDIEAEETPGADRFDAMEELSRDIERRIRDNQRFLERLLDEDFEEDEADEAGEDEWPEEEL